MAYGYDFDTIAGLASAAIDACWAPEDEKAVLKRRFAAEIATLRR